METTDPGSGSGIHVPKDHQRGGRGRTEGTEMSDRTENERLLSPSEVAQMFRVNHKTVTRWARAGKISAIRTLGGHRRFRESEIRKFLEQVETEELEDF
jgi:excisionase family DNA binding protein